MKQRHHHHTRQDESQTQTFAVTHIRLGEMNASKLAALDELAQAYLSLCQQYVNLFSTALPPRFLNAGTGTPSSKPQVSPNHGAPTAHRRTRTMWMNGWAIMSNRLKASWMQRQQNPYGESGTYHNKREDGWWLTLSYDEVVPVQTGPSAPVVGVDVGIANFLTTSDGKHYGTFHGKLRERQKRDREKRRRKAKLRTCLEKKRVKKLPSTSSRSGQRLALHVRQEINRAVNQCFADHEGAQFAYEQLSVDTMKFKARAMNASKRGRAATKVKCAYSSQECSVCHYPDRANRPPSSFVNGRRSRLDVWAMHYLPRFLATIGYERQCASS